MNEMVNMRSELIRSDDNYYKEKNELIAQMSKLRREFEEYKNQFTEKELNLHFQIKLLQSVIKHKDDRNWRKSV